MILLNVSYGNFFDSVIAFLNAIWTWLSDQWSALSELLELVSGGALGVSVIVTQGMWQPLAISIYLVIVLGILKLIVGR